MCLAIAACHSVRLSSWTALMTKLRQEISKTEKKMKRKTWL